MNASTWSRPSLWRVVIFALVVGLAVNTLLWAITFDTDWFAKTISVASGACAFLILVAWRFRPALLDELLIIAFAIWVANIIEFATSEGPRWESQVRQCGLYAAEALLALGAFVAHKTNRVHE